MSKDEIDFEFTVKDLDQMVLDAARGNEGIEGNKAKPTRPNFLEMLKTGGKLEQLNTGK